jgi:hypothetical protein
MARGLVKWGTVQRGSGQLEIDTSHSDAIGTCSCLGISDGKMSPGQSHSRMWGVMKNVCSLDQEPLTSRDAYLEVLGMAGRARDARNCLPHKCIQDR